QAYDTFYANAEALKLAFESMRSTSGAAAASGVDLIADVTNAVAAAATASTTETSSSFTIADPTPAIVLLRHLLTVKDCPRAYYAGVYGVDMAAPRVPLPDTVDAPPAVPNGNPPAVTPAPPTPSDRSNSVDQELRTLANARALALGKILSGA